MTGEPRQPSYMDLSDGQQVRFGGQCGICGAQYASRPILTQGATGAPIREMRKTALAQFDVAWRDLQVSCYRCGRGACPECWDAESRMCVECADARGLARAPFSPPTQGPLVDGRLVLTDRGKYSRVAQPAWVGNLIASGQGTNAGDPAPAEVDPSMQPWMLALTTTGDHAREVYPGAPIVPAPARTLASELTEQIPTAPNSQPLPPPVLPPDEGSTSFGGAGVYAVEGNANGAMVACPRCGTPNYDFVTQCTACQLQLVQICPNCEKLNAGQAVLCASCGAGLSRPRGWSGVLPPLSPDILAATKRDVSGSGTGQAPGSALVDAGARPSHQEGTVSTRIVPVTPRPYGLAHAAPTYTPGGMAPVATVPPPPPERGKRRRVLAAAANGGSATAAGGHMLSEVLYPAAPMGRVAKVAAVLDRLSGWILLLVVALFVGMIVAAEASTSANAALRGIIHIDIRQMLAQFASQMQMLWQRLHH